MTAALEREENMQQIAIGILNHYTGWSKWQLKLMCALVDRDVNGVYQRNMIPDTGQETMGNWEFVTLVIDLSLAQQCFVFHCVNVITVYNICHWPQVRCIKEWVMLSRIGGRIARLSHSI
jgi:hypothetical protein